MQGIYFIIFIGVLIFVHELGHFLFCKLFGVKVLRFSLGFGPKLFSHQIGETEYQLRWIPLGGYVKMLGEEQDQEIEPEDQGRALNHKPLWQRYLIVLGGPMFNLLLPLPIYFVAFMATSGSLLPSSVGIVVPDMPAAQAGLRPGDRIEAIEGKPVKYWHQLEEIVASSPGKPLTFQVNRDNKRFSAAIVPADRVERNRLNIEERHGRIGIRPDYLTSRVGLSDPSAPAAKAGLRTFDLIVAVNGERVAKWVDLGRLMRAQAGKEVKVLALRPLPVDVAGVSIQTQRPVEVTMTVPQAEAPLAALGIASSEMFIMKVTPGSPADQAGLSQGDAIVSLDGKEAYLWGIFRQEMANKPDETYQIGVIKKGYLSDQALVPPQRDMVSIKQSRKEDKGYESGIVSYVFGAQNFSNRTDLVTDDLIDNDNLVSYAFGKAYTTSVEALRFMVIGLVQLLRGEISLRSVGGPIMIYDIAGKAAQRGWDFFLGMMAIISINLGLINLFPIPILDGGHLVFFTLEAIKGRPLSQRFRAVAFYLGLLLLVTIMVLALHNDLQRYWSEFTGGL